MSPLTDSCSAHPNAFDGDVIVLLAVMANQPLGIPGVGGGVEGGLFPGWLEPLGIDKPVSCY